MIDEEEMDHIVVTEMGQNRTTYNDHQRMNRQSRFRRDSQSSSSPSTRTITAKTITAPEGSNITRPLSERSAFTERGTDSSSTIHSQDEESVATEEPSSEDWSESQSTISIGTVRETEDLVFEYEEDDQSSVSTMCDRIQGLPRPKTGWNTAPEGEKCPNTSKNNKRKGETEYKLRIFCWK